MALERKRFREKSSEIFARHDGSGASAEPSAQIVERPLRGSRADTVAVAE